MINDKTVSECSTSVCNVLVEPVWAIAIAMLVFLLICFIGIKLILARTELTEAEIEEQEERVAARLYPEREGRIYDPPPARAPRCAPADNLGSRPGGPDPRPDRPKPSQ